MLFWVVGGGAVVVALIIAVLQGSLAISLLMAGTIIMVVLQVTYPPSAPCVMRRTCPRTSVFASMTSLSEVLSIFVMTLHAQHLTTGSAPLM